MDKLQFVYTSDVRPVVRAEWIKETDRDNHSHCSACGVVWGVSAKAMKYCPGCGAKMINCPLWDMYDEWGKPDA